MAHAAEPRRDPAPAADAGAPAADAGAPAAAADAPLVVVAFPRSGTSLLRVMLEGHPGLAILPEPGWMIRLLRRLDREPGPIARDRAAALLRGGVDPAWWTAAELDPRAAEAELPDGPASPAAIAGAPGRAYARRRRKARWGLKHPGAEFRRSIRYLHAHFPAGAFVFLARDPRDVFVSQLDARWRSGTADLELFGVLWRLQARRMLADLARVGPRAATVRYEDLLADPAATLARVAGLAGLRAGPAEIDAMLAFRGNVQARVLANPIHAKLAGPVLGANRDRFLERLSPEQVRRMEAACGAELAQLGYARASFAPSGGDSLGALARAGAGLARNTVGVLRRRTTISGIRRGLGAAAGGQSAGRPTRASPTPSSTL